MGSRHMPSWGRRSACMALGLGLGALLPVPVWAQGAGANANFTLVPGFQPGGVVDLVARRLGDRLAAVSGRTVIVDNKPGASGNVAAAYVAQKPGDGTMLLITLYDGLVNTKATGAKVPFDPIDDLKPVALVGMTDVAMVVRADAAATSFLELMAYAREREEPLKLGSSGIGSSYHLLIERIKADTGIPFVHVPYSRGGGAQMLDLIAGRIDAAFGTLNIVMPHVKSGRLRPLAVAGETRSAVLPQLPTIKEAGFPQLSIAQGIGIFSPGGTPEAINAALSTQIGQVVAEPAFGRWLQDNGITPVSLGHRAFADRYRHETTALAQQLQRIHFKLTE